MSKEAMKLDKEDITTAKEMAKVLRRSGKDELIVVGMLLDALLKEREEALAKQEQDVNWKDMYEKEKRRSAMWSARYEKDIGQLERATPQQEQSVSVGEPVAYIRDVIEGLYENGDPISVEAAELIDKLYTTPQQRKPLTDEQIYAIQTSASFTWKGFARAIEAAHGIKE